ncbi:hypothetical protein [Niabella hibiscisoli]|uniref:hypothetical protein n=1 Tax=Niabella hibiscisoli TaxID=1825928 RepID=UPI001F116457|nr:hypothetical protein [Niabella hibiscisoli]MCH5721250.1 hypothetical protein [Niabella hibiscisoli]
MPLVNTMGKDAFGFYNGYDNNTTLLKTIIPPNITAESYHNSKREVNEVYTKAGSLRQITYPTSGGIRLYTSVNQSGDYYAPGLKVDKVELFDQNGNVVNTKIYGYEQLEGLKIKFPDYAMLENPVDPALFGAPQCFSYSSENTFQQLHLPANFFYKKVTIKEIGDGKESTTVEFYDDPNPYATNEPLEEYVFQPVLTGREFYNGNPVSGVKVKSESYNYQPVINQQDGANIYEPLPPYLGNINLSDNGGYTTFPCLNYQPGFVVKSVRRAKWMRLESQSEVYFDNQGGSYIAESFHYYDNPSHKYATRIASTRSKGGFVDQEMKYPQDMVQASNDPLGVYQLMSSKNIIGKPIIFMEKMNGKSKGQMNEYTTSVYGFPVLGAIKSFNAVSAQFEERSRYNTYDSHGNILEMQNNDGPVICFVYGYSGRYLLAKVIGSNYNTVSTFINQTMLDNAHQYTDAQIQTELKKFETVWQQRKHK